MSNVKDKLSASMRTVKAGGKPAAKPAAAKKTAPRKPARKALAKAKPAVPGDVPESGTALFPARVWPD
ncbi:MAG: hypothetical protein ABFS23_02750 [Pseudomonadota bacterium]